MVFRLLAGALTLALVGCVTDGATDGATMSTTDASSPFGVAPLQETPSVPIKLTALDCGRIDVADLNIFSDTDAYPNTTFKMIVSCYLIQHGDDYMIFDLGLPDALHDEPLRVPDQVLYSPVTLASQLDALGLTPDDISTIVVSHGHYDHAGNVNMFPNATLIVQAVEWDAIFNGGSGPMYPELFSEFADGENVMKVTGDYDIYGDGSVTTIFTPGHTPGHQSLLVRLANAGPVILSGDWAHLRENRENREVPDFNWNRAETLASFDRLERLADHLGARIIIAHDPRDFATLPKAPAYLN